METNELIGAEALSRWNYKNKNLLSPSDFIPILEKNNLITELDYYVLEKVCQYIKTLLNNNKKVVPISVNLSKNQYDLNYYIERAKKICEHYDVDPSYIEIEITESMYISNREVLINAVDKLHELGFKVSIDDFGSGYSNLSVLADLNFDILKIDKSLCSGTYGKKNIILNSVIQMTKNLNISLICEGIENEEQANVVLKSGCKYAQGYLYDKPLPIFDFTIKYLR